MQCLKRSIKATSPVRLIVLLLCSVFFGEILIMVFLNQIQRLSFWKYTALDALLMLTIMFPAFYYFLFRPLIRQIQDRKITESILKKSEERYRNIFENVQDVYYEVTLDGILTEVSPSVSRMSMGQYGRLDLLGSSVYDLYANASDRDILLSVLYKQGEVWDYEVMLKNKDGSPFYSSISAKICFDKHHIPLKITGSMRDITVRKQNEEEIRNKNNQLRLINSEKDKLFSIIAHDLRSPLSAFIGLTELMSGKDHSLSASEMQKFAGSIHNTATNLYGLLENLLLWSGTRQGSLPFVLRHLSLRSLVKDAIVTLNEIAENKNIEISCDISNDITVYADANALQTILRNLTSNALKFTPYGGKISIAARSVADDKTEIEVTDTGIGIDKEMIGKLFSIDNNINRPGTDGEPSTGLGLLLCKEFIEKHNGAIRVTSEVGKGSRFYFVI